MLLALYLAALIKLSLFLVYLRSIREVIISDSLL